MLVSTWEHKEARQSITVEQVGASQFTVTLAGCINATVRCGSLAAAEKYAHSMQDAALGDLALKRSIAAYLAGKH